MKSCLFHFLPYQALPDDFVDRYQSAWVTPPNAELCDSREVSRGYQRYLDQLELADRLGFDAIGINEHHQTVHGLDPSPNLMAAALARRTPNGAAILVMGSTVPLHQPPNRLAEEYAVLDCLSEGRLIAGLPLGTPMDVNFSYGVNPTETRARYAEALDLVLQAWERPGPFPFNGRFTQLRYVNTWPKPLQQPRPPLWFGGNGSVETWSLACDLDSPYNQLAFYGTDNAARIIQPYWEHVEARGLDHNPYRLGVAHNVLVADTDAEAERLYKKHVDEYFNTPSKIPRAFLEPPGYKTRASMEFAAKTAMYRPGVRPPDWATMVEEGYVIAGSAATVADRLIEIAKRLNGGTVIAQMQIGKMPDDLARENITRYAEGVIPKIRPVFSEWEHKWWPSGAQHRERAAKANGVAEEVGA